MEKGLTLTCSRAQPSRHVTLNTLVPEVFLVFSSFREAANTSSEAARKKNLWLPWT